MTPCISDPFVTVVNVKKKVYFTLKFRFMKLIEKIKAL